MASRICMYRSVVKAFSVIPAPHVKLLTYLLTYLLLTYLLTYGVYM